MTLPIVIRPRAESDIQAIHHWYEAERAGLGEDFLQTLRLTGLSQNPEVCAIIHKNVRRAVLPRFPYVIFYIATRARIVVLAVMHASRNPAAWPRR
jgi:plasmid stabilization system protein ParE